MRESGRTPVRCGVVGTGWRAGFFVRLAQLVPEILDIAGVVSRDPERARELGWGVPVFGSVEELVAETDPAFVISSVTWQANPAVVEQLVEAGVAVLSETPPAPDVTALKDLWGRVGESGLVQVAEQYPLMPMHSARLEAVRAGLIGAPSSVHVSSTHQYHAIALLRGFLGVGLGDVQVRASTSTAELLDPMTRAGLREDMGPHPATTTMATLDFGPGRSGLYDFTDNQWHNRLRARRLLVRGSHGEINDESVIRWDGRVLTSPLLRHQSGYDLDLEGYDSEYIALDGHILWTNPFIGLRLPDEEIAILTQMVAMAAWRRGDGPAPYPLAQASHDHAIALAVEQAAVSGETVEVSDLPWSV
ncbi:hypothetical protein GCM10022223_53730 [Kineosporia mesophila]|uniref:Gfo/Idh/MocA-like oxidoreductase N-terminal domain-containing protein n=1 Tax=Kineosporia mesophila TaxID=566012 RepID=A0ABP7ACJ4_9ACTN|nr:Gfo/Idh/MocA family oxidoreductase [Kineosporia mesophila]MCD5351248.1 Gfo/Idh/MocA family oxidoreductase [Kineosporia mesophila]